MCIRDRRDGGVRSIAIVFELAPRGAIGWFHAARKRSAGNKVLHIVAAEHRGGVGRSAGGRKGAARDGDVHVVMGVAVNFILPHGVLGALDNAARDIDLQIVPGDVLYRRDAHAHGGGAVVIARLGKYTLARDGAAAHV